SRRDGTNARTKMSAPHRCPGATRDLSPALQRWVGLLEAEDRSEAGLDVVPRPVIVVDSISAIHAQSDGSPEAFQPNSGLNRQLRQNSCVDPCGSSRSSRQRARLRSDRSQWQRPAPSATVPHTPAPQPMPCVSYGLFSPIGCLRVDHARLRSECSETVLGKMQTERPLTEILLIPNEHVLRASQGNADCGSSLRRRSDQ